MKRWAMITDLMGDVSVPAVVQVLWRVSLINMSTTEEGVKTIKAHLMELTRNATALFVVPSKETQSATIGDILVPLKAQVHRQLENTIYTSTSDMLTITTFHLAARSPQDSDLMNLETILFKKRILAQAGDMSSQDENLGMATNTVTLSIMAKRQGAGFPATDRPRQVTIVTMDINIENARGVLTQPSHRVTRVLTRSSSGAKSTARHDDRYFQQIDNAKDTNIATPIKKIADLTIQRGVQQTMICAKITKDHVVVSALDQGFRRKATITGKNQVFKVPLVQTDDTKALIGARTTLSE
jgi:hypothetical protein